MNLDGVIVILECELDAIRAALNLLDKYSNKPEETHEPELRCSARRLILALICTTLSMSLRGALIKLLLY